MKHTLTHLSALTALLLAPLAAVAMAQDQTTGLDEFGGATPLSAGKATGAFRVAEVNGRQLFVTPAGHGFFSLGVTHVRHYLDSSKSRPMIWSGKNQGPEC